MKTVRVAWHTEDLPCKRGGASSKTEYRHFHGEYARELAEHYVAHVVSPTSPEWYRIEEVG